MCALVGRWPGSNVVPQLSSYFEVYCDDEGACGGCWWFSHAQALFTISVRFRQNQTTAVLEISIVVVVAHSTVTFSSFCSTQSLILMMLSLVLSSPTRRKSTRGFPSGWMMALRFLVLLNLYFLFSSCSCCLCRRRWCSSSPTRRRSTRRFPSRWTMAFPTRFVGYCCCLAARNHPQTCDESSIYAVLSPSFCFELFIAGLFLVLGRSYFSL